MPGHEGVGPRPRADLVAEPWFEPRGARARDSALVSLKAWPTGSPHETSPYLLQHKDNPVDWYPWGEEALERALELDRPILLSIGYSSCHWCHVMERESFEDDETARFMNEHFVPIKVDREERPDVDAIYMEAVQGMTGHGGWPLTAFCDPEGVPFYGGTYFPPEPRQGMPSFPMVMEAVVAVVGDAARADPRVGRRGSAASSARSAGSSPPTSRSRRGIVDAAVEQLRGLADMRHGGFGAGAEVPAGLGARAAAGARGDATWSR